MKIKFTSVEQLDQYLYENNLPGLDPEQSKNMQELASAFSAKGLHLNRWWVITPIDWRCPACGRGKKEIVRLNKHGFLTCHLHAHHDHIENILKKEFELFSKSQEEIVADEISEKFIKRAAYGLAAFDTTIICSDCNKAEGEAKLLASTNVDFTFSPSEIRKFVIPNDNHEHGISADVAVDIWTNSSAIFEKRLEFIRNLAKVAAENMHWYQPSFQTSNQVERIAKYHIQRYGLNDLSTEPEKLLYKTVPFTGEKSSWRRKKSSRVRKFPSEKDVDYVVAMRKNFWGKVSDDWNCPCCQRSKQDCIYFSENKKWVFEVKEIETYDSYINNSERIMLCNDCANAVIHIGREGLDDIDLYPPSIIVGISELKEIIIPSPHYAHSYQNHIADSLVPKLRARAEQIQKTKGVHLTTSI